MLARWAALLVVLGTPCAALRADSVWIQSGTGNPIVITGVKVVGVQTDSLVYNNSVGRPISKPLAQVPQIGLDDEPAFSAAEEAFRGKQFPVAAENYEKTLQTTAKDWVKERSAVRLVQAANSTGNFPVAVQGFIQLVQLKPAAATENKPATPANGTAINQGIADLKQALSNGKLAAEQKSVLNNFLAELFTAKGDTASATAAVGQMANAGTTGGNDPANQKVAADARLTEARQAYSQRQYAKASQVLDSNGAVFADPAQRAEALFLLAQATSAAAPAGDTPKLQDSALAYMRVVAAGDALPGKPHVADALFAVAAIEEKLKSTKEALAIYDQIALEFAGTAMATKAKENASRLSAAAAASPKS